MAREMPDLPRSKLLQLIGLQAAVFTFHGAVCWWASGRALAEFVVFDLRDLGLGVALGAGMSAAAWASFRLFPRAGEALMRMQAPTYPFLKDRLGPGAVIFVSLCAGIGEEALYRGGAQSWMSDYIGPAPGIAVAALIFTVSHMARPPVAAIIFAIGILFGAIFWYTGSLLIVMVGHAVYDVFALAYLQDRLHALGVFDTADETSEATGETENAID